MNHREQAIIYAIFFTIWLVRLYYKLYDKKTKRYVMEIGFLIVFWMFVKIIKSVLLNSFWIRFCWYLYYFPLIFIPAILYICSKQLDNKKYIYLIIASILLIFVLTNDFHELVFKFNNGLDDYDNYTHNLGYYVICLWIFYLLGKSMICLALARLKIKKDYKVYLPILLLLAGLIYTILYVCGIPFIASSNMACILSTIICLGMELILYLDLIPNNQKYKQSFTNSSLNMAIVSLDGNTIYNTKNFQVPSFLIQDIKKGNIREKIEKKNTLFNIKKNKDSSVIFKKDITLLNDLQKELNDIQIKLLRQTKKLEKEKQYRKRLQEINLRNDIIKRIENDILIRKEKALRILDEKQLSKNDFQYIKLVIAYAKRKSSLIISEINNDYFTDDGVKLVINELFNDCKYKNINGEMFIKNIKISSFQMNILYEILFSIFEILDNSNIVIFVTNDYFKIMIDKNINVKDVINIKNINIIEKQYDNDIELIIKEVK